ncbi:YsnF/AvaK domain-containing protein [Psychrobacter sp.]|uniref:YsnF/AvaK domain-containing protein n=1 Tax=Psychrobacter sp. TaxID=56811 RepID=UPI0025DC506B|nr:YsnF/AvaK domain-containing protein [Psychrobacter sp.]
MNSISNNSTASQSNSDKTNLDNINPNKNADSGQHVLSSNNITDNTSTSHITDPNRSLVGKIELLEERAVIDKERLDVGKVTVSKEIRTKTVNVPVELVEEVMVISTEYYDPDSRQLLTNVAREQDLVRHIEPTLTNKASITVNGTEVFLDQEPVEIVLSRQVAIIKKETYVVQDIAIEKSKHIHKDTFEVELKHEELEVKEEGYFDHEVRKP